MWLRLALGALYVAMAGGQVASWSRMPAILGAYDAVPTAVLPSVAVVLVVAELAAGGWLLARPRSAALTPVWIYTGVTVVWAALGLQAQLRGVTVTNCGCFGVYLSQRLSWFVLAQDGLLLVYAGLMVRAARPIHRRWCGVRRGLGHLHRRRRTAPAGTSRYADGNLDRAGMVARQPRSRQG